MADTCSCGREAVINGLCWTHYTDQYTVPTPPLSPRTAQKPERVVTPTVCIIDGCDGIPHARGMCGACYQRWRTRPTDYSEKYGLPERPKCRIESCEGLLDSHGLCTFHYHREQAGLPPEVVTKDQSKTVLRVIEEMVNVLSGDLGPLVSAEMNGNGLIVNLKYQDGREAKCKLRVEEK